MGTMINWYQMRGLGVLAAIGLFLVYAVLAGRWQARKADTRATGLTEQDAPAPAEPSMPHAPERRAA
jgi:hypothetical protein